MRAVDRSGVARPSSELWGYWIPDPSLLIGPRNEERVQRYMMNWLRIREGWLYLLGLPDTPATRVGAQWWRDYLNGDTANAMPEENTRRAERLEKVKTVFIRAFMMEDFAPAVSQPVQWFNYSVSRLDNALATRILWEIYDLGFRYELMALDRVLVPMHNVQDAERIRGSLLSLVFAQRDLYRIKYLPTVPEGLGARYPYGRARFVEALRQVVLRWPLCPDDIVQGPTVTHMSPPGITEAMEKAVAKFYCRSFFAYSGRAPLVPHAFPPP